MVFGELGDHGAHDAQLVHALTDVRKEAADRNAALAVLREFPRAAEGVAVVVELGGLHGRGEGLAMIGLQAWLRIKTVHLRNAAIHVEKDDVLGAGGELGQTRGQGAGVRAESAIAEQGRERNGPKTGGALPQHVAPAQRAGLNLSTIGHVPSPGLSADKHKFLQREQGMAEVRPRTRITEDRVAGGLERFCLRTQERDRLRDFLRLRRARANALRYNCAMRCSGVQSGVAQICVAHALACSSTNGSFKSTSACAGTFETLRAPWVVLGVGKSKACSSAGRKLRRTSR